MKIKISFEINSRNAPEIAEILCFIAKKEGCTIALDSESDRVVDLAQYLMENGVDVVISQHMLSLLSERIEKEEVDAFPPTGKINLGEKEIKLDDLPF